MSTDTGLQLLYVGGHSVTAGVAGLLSYWITENTEIPGERWFVLWMGNFALWSGVSAVSVASAAQPLAYLLFVLWIVVGLAGVLLTVCFATAYSGRDPVTNRVCQGSAVVTLLFAMVAMTGSVHGQYWNTVSFLETPFPHFAVKPGVGWIAALLFGVFAVGVLVYYFAELYFRSRRRQQSAIMVLMAGAVLGFLPLLFSELDLLLVPTYDHTSFAGSINAFAVSYAVMRFGTHSISTVARDEVVDHLAGPYVTLDWERRVVDFNEASRQLAAEEIQLGEPLETVFPALADTLVTATGIEEPDDVITLTNGGEPQHYAVTVSMLPQQASANGSVIFLSNVTDLEASRRVVQQQNNQLDAFASTVSHDLRSPLHIAQGRLGLARAERDSEHFDEIETAHKRMETLIDDLLMLARDGQQVGELVAVDLATRANRGWQQVDTADATLNTPVDRHIQADPNRLQQLLENLFRNSVDHGREDVTVTVGDLDDGFYIADDGPGIPEDQREDVFEMNYSTGGGGTGLGLHIVDQVVEAHGWTVTLTESVDGGARFEISSVGDENNK